MSVTRKLLLGYLTILVLGFVCLNLPFASIQDLHWIDHLFMATSALSTTGLMTLDIGTNYTFFGQAVILLLIQIGGIGYLTIGCMLALSLHHQFNKEEYDLIRNDLNLPLGYGFVDIVKLKIVLTLIVEIVGALILFFLFNEADKSDAIWHALFHSVSAFCTAGLTLFADNLAGFQTNYAIQLVIISLSIMGSLGFIVFTDIYRVIRHRHRKLTVTSKVILSTLTLVVFIGTMLLFFFESNLAGYNMLERLWISVFHVLSATTTAGFNTLPITDFLPASLFLLCMLMYIGASPTGTGGGLKTTTIAIVFAKMVSTFKAAKQVVFFNSEVPESRVNLTMSSVILYTAFIYGGVLVFLYLQKEPFMDLFFEVSSAIGTVGLTTGLTPELETSSKLLVCLLMFVGRLTPVAIGMVLFESFQRKETIVIKEDVAT